MKKVLIGAAGAVLLLLAAALIVPGFVDWNAYKTEIAEEIGRFTGRRLTIGGDLRLTMLPVPTLVATDVRLANIDGAADPQMLGLKSLEVRIGLAPLLAGEIQVGKVRLVEPVVRLEVLADGRRNWVFAGRRRGNEADVPGARATPTPTPFAELPLAVRLDGIEIVDGIVVYRDAVAGTGGRIEAINATLSATSLAGPFEVRGELRAGATPLGLRLSVGEIVGDHGVPVALSVLAEPGASRLELRGIARRLSTAPTFEGRATADGENLARLIQALVPAALPGFLGQRFDLDGEVTASADNVVIGDLAIRLGDARASGALAASLGEQPSITGQLTAGSIDLDSWLAMPAVPARATPTAGFRLPEGISASTAVSADAILFRRGIIRRARADARLVGGEITVSRVSALLPGASEVALSGSVTTPDGAPQFEGEIEARSADLHGVLDWIGVDTSAVPPGRLRTAAARSKLVVYPELVQARDIDVQLDGSRITGGVTWAIARRLAFGADLTVDRLNLDPFLASASAERASAMDTAGSSLPFAVLRSFDANLRVHLLALAFRGADITDVIVDTTLFDGTLEVHRASIADFAGASFDAAGTVHGLGAEPTLKSVAFDLQVADVERLLRAAGLPPPPQARTLGPLSVTGHAEGTVAEPIIGLSIRALDAELGLAGTLALAPAPRFEGRMTLQGADTVRLLDALAVGYRPAGPIGPVDLAGRVQASASGLSFQELAGTIGDVAVGGSVAASLLQRRPRIDADLTTGRLAIDPFLPARRTTAVTPRLVPASWRPAPAPDRHEYPALRHVAAEPRERWSREPLDLGMLNRFDADLKLRSAAVAYGDYVLENADLTASLVGGILTAGTVTGSLFGGALNAAGRIDATGIPTVETKIALDDADLGLADAAVADGRLTGHAQLTTRGQTVAALVSALDGSGSLALSGLRTAGGRSGGALAPLFALVDGLGRIGGDAATTVDLAATYSVENGIVRSSDMRVTSAIGEATATGIADLPAWRIDVTGEFRVTHAGAERLGGEAPGSRMPQILPFWLRGPLDSPDVKVDMGKMSGAIRIPGPVAPAEDASPGAVRTQ